MVVKVLRPSRPRGKETWPLYTREESNPGISKLEKSRNSTIRADRRQCLFHVYTLDPCLEVFHIQAFVLEVCSLEGTGKKGEDVMTHNPEYLIPEFFHRYLPAFVPSVFLTEPYLNTMTSLPQLSHGV